jgi:hypothetical protein
MSFMSTHRDPFQRVPHERNHTSEFAQPHLSALHAKEDEPALVEATAYPLQPGPQPLLAPRTIAADERR